MKTSLKVSRSVQLVGCALLIVGVGACTMRDTSLLMSTSFMVGFMLIVGARIHEWLTKE